jgi:hypothetical protein
MAGGGRGCVIAHPASHTVCSPQVNLTMRGQPLLEPVEGAIGRDHQRERLGRHRSRRSTASRAKPTRSRWPTTPLPPPARGARGGGRGSPPISTAATRTGASSRPSNTASSPTEFAPFGAVSGRPSRARPTRAPRDRPAPERRSGSTLVGSGQSAAPAAHRLSPALPRSG